MNNLRRIIPAMHPPPCAAGMQPRLSINDESHGGNGPAQPQAVISGVVFSLSGLSTISRVGRTVAQDGVKGGVSFDANDRFALDTAPRRIAHPRHAKPHRRA